MQQQRLDIQRHFHPEHFKSVPVGENEIFIVVGESSLPISKGAAVLVGETGRNGVSNMALASLAPYLNGFGWSTILVSAPELNFELPGSEPEAETESDNNQESSTPPGSDPQRTANDLPPPNQYIPSEFAPTRISSAQFEAQEQAFQILMNSVENERQSFPGFFLVIAQGTSAAWLTKMYADNALPLPDALVTLGINWPQQNLNEQLPEIISRTEVPILDIYNQFDNDWTRNSADTRRITTIKSLKLHYRQRELIGPQIEHYQMDYLSREIHGWLTYLGW